MYIFTLDAFCGFWTPPMAARITFWYVTLMWFYVITIVIFKFFLANIIWIIKFWWIKVIFQRHTSSFFSVTNLFIPKTQEYHFFKNLYDEQKQKLTVNFVNKPGATGYSFWHCLLSEQSTILINWYLLPYGLVFSAQNLVTVVFRLIHITFW